VSRAEACLSQLKELNSYVNVSVHNGVVNPDFLKNFDVVIFTESYNQQELENINAFCRQNQIGFIYGG